MRGKHSILEERMHRHMDELKWLYMELYDSPAHFEELCAGIREFYEKRKPALKRQDKKREEDPAWFKRNNMLGMMMYAGNFGTTLSGVGERLDYIRRCNVNYLHLMPLLESPVGRSDGGYAVADFRKVQEELGTIGDLEALADKCRRRGISLCLDFVMNHTSEDHAWAKRARNGEKEYMDRYFFCDRQEDVDAYERTVPQVFPTTAPGNFTWLPEMGKYVLTTFYPYQWDLNYRNPVVFNEMMYNFLFLANLGIDVIRIDAVPYIWKELGTNCRNLPKVHTIVRMMRMIGEIVCPGVLLLGEVVMEPEKVAPYFGTVEKPECHMLYNVTTMASIWHTVATEDARLLKKQLETVAGLPKEYTFLNYLRCHDDIGWGLDYGTLRQYGMEEISHKAFLNEFFTGNYPASFSRGELYNNDPVTKDARFCGTTASMCGIEKAGFCGDEAGMDAAIRLDLMLHAFMFMQSGIPVIYSGDEVGQVNDYSYKEDPEKREDSRYIHRGKFCWDLVEKIGRPGTVQNRLFAGLDCLEGLRAADPVFDSRVPFYMADTGDKSVLCMVRRGEQETAAGVFNFSREEKRISINDESLPPVFVDMKSGEERKIRELSVPGFGFYWMRQVR